MKKRENGEQLGHSEINLMKAYQQKLQQSTVMQMQQMQQIRTR